MIKTSVLQQILVSELQARVDGDSYFIEEDVRASIMLHHTGGVMQVPKVRQITFSENYLTIVTMEDRYFVEHDIVFGVRRDDPEQDKDDARPGFRR